MDTSLLIEEIIPPALIAFFVSVVWGVIHEDSKARRAFILSTSNELKTVLTTATRDGREYWLSSNADRSAERFALVAMQAEIVGLISLLEEFGYNPLDARENFCDALTGGDFDVDGSANALAAVKLNSTSTELRLSVDSFTIQTVKRPIARILFMPIRLMLRWWNNIFN